MVKIYTKKGDQGCTGLIGGKKVLKDSVWICAIGEIDELNAITGISWIKNKDRKVGRILNEIQKDLFTLGADISTPLKNKGRVKRISSRHVKKIEKFIDEYSGIVEPLGNFILPGGSEEAAFLHLARAACRRAERAVTSLMKEEKINEYALPFLNRLSDLFFVLARFANERAGIYEEKWEGKGK